MRYMNRRPYYWPRHGSTSRYLGADGKFHHLPKSDGHQTAILLQAVQGADDVRELSGNNGARVLEIRMNVINGGSAIL